MDKETIIFLAQQIVRTGEVTPHQASVLLEYALHGVESKKDLSDGEQLTIQSIRKMIKGL